MYLLCPLLGIACLWDYSTGRIPNFLQFNLLCIGLLYSYSRTGWRGVLLFTARLVVVGIIFIPLFMLRVLGAGDVKALALAAGYLETPRILWFIFYVMLIAAVFSLLFSLFNNFNSCLFKQFSKQFSEQFPECERSKGIRKAKGIRKTKETKSIKGIKRPMRIKKTVALIIRVITDSFILSIEKLISRLRYFIEYMKNCVNTKRLTPYHRDRADRKKYSVVMSGPMLVSALLALGGVY